MLSSSLSIAYLLLNSLLYVRLSYVFSTLSVFDFFFFKQKTAYEMRISDWSSDVCPSDLQPYVFMNSFFGKGFVPVAGSANVSGGGCGVKRPQIGRASCRERVCQYVYSSVVAVSLKQKITQLRKRIRV